MLEQYRGSAGNGANMYPNTLRVNRRSPLVVSQFGLEKQGNHKGCPYTHCKAVTFVGAPLVGAVG